MDEKESIRKRTKYRHHMPKECINKHSNHPREDTLECHPDNYHSKVTITLQNVSKLYHRVLEKVHVTSSTNVVKLLAVLVMLGYVNTTLAASAEGSDDNQNSFSSNSKDNQGKTGRGGKSLFFNNPLTDLYFNNQYQNEELMGGSNEDYMDNTDDEMMSRARPSGSNRKKYEDSPIYYIRIPPSPYVHVPGYGYVSETPSLKPPPQVVENERPNKINNGGQYNQNYMQPNQNTYQDPSPQPNYMSSLMGAMSNYMPSQNYMNFNPAPAPSNYYSNYQNPMNNLPYQNEQYNSGGTVYPANTFPLNSQYGGSGGSHNKYQNSPIYNLPLQFLANGKPTNIYTLPNEIQAAPVKPSKPHRPDSPIYHLDKGPYVFNGKPNDIFMLRNAYNDALYDETINNFYP